MSLNTATSGKISNVLFKKPEFIYSLNTCVNLRIRDYIFSVSLCEEWKQEVGILKGKEKEKNWNKPIKLLCE